MAMTHISSRGLGRLFAVVLNARGATMAGVGRRNTTVVFAPNRGTARTRAVSSLRAHRPKHPLELAGRETGKAALVRRS